MSEIKLFVGITKDNELIQATLDISERDKYNNNGLCGLKEKGIKTFWINTDIYRNIIDEETGEDEARETLSDSEYWNDLGMIDQKSFLTGFINFKE